MAKVGFEAKLYRNEGTYETPDWTELVNVRDLTLALEEDEADVTTRASGGWKETIGGLKDSSIEGETVWEAGDDDFEALRDAWLNRTPIELAVLDGDIETAGSQGLRASFAVLKFSRQEKLNDTIVAEITLKPTRAAHAPEWMTVAAPPPGN